MVDNPKVDLAVDGMVANIPKARMMTWCETPSRHDRRLTTWQGGIHERGSPSHFEETLRISLTMGETALPHPREISAVRVEVVLSPTAGASHDCGSVSFIAE